MGIWERGVDGRLTELEKDLDELGKESSPHLNVTILENRLHKQAEIIGQIQVEIADLKKKNSEDGQFVCRRLNHYEGRIVKLEKQTGALIVRDDRDGERISKLEANDENKRWRISNLECPSPMMVKHEEMFNDAIERIDELEAEIAILRNPPKTVTMKCGDRIVNTWTEPSRCDECKFFRYSHEAKEHGCYRLSQGKYWCIRSKSEISCGYFEREV
jgi:hypothetical protein